MADPGPDPASAAARSRLLHDLRSPLAIIDGFSALLERDDGALTPEQRRDFAARIRAAAADMRRLLDGG